MFELKKYIQTAMDQCTIHKTSNHVIYPIKHSENVGVRMHENNAFPH